MILAEFCRRVWWQKTIEWCCYQVLQIKSLIIYAAVSDVKFHEIFCPEIFHEIFLKYLKNFTMFFSALCIVHCNKVSKPIKGKYLLLCMNSIMYLLLTWYTFIVFLKVLSHLILKIKSFMKYIKKGSWNISKFLWIFLIFQREIFHRASLVAIHITNLIIQPGGRNGHWHISRFHAMYRAFWQMTVINHYTINAFTQ